MSPLVLGVLLFCFARPAAAQPDRFGIVNDNIETADNVPLRAKEAGFGWMRFTIYWSMSNPQPGVFDWTIADRGIALADAAGFKIYVTVSFPPTWATGATYPNDQAIFFCVGNPGHPDCGPNAKRIPTRASFEAFARAMVGRYKDRVDAWSFGAEVHNRLFWQGTTDEFVERILRPGYLIVKEVAGASVPVAGADEDDEGTAYDLLVLEQKYGQWCDVISFHVLSQSLGPQTIAQRLDSFKTNVIDRDTRRRPAWLTELGTGRQPGNCAEETAQAYWLGEAFASVLARPWIERAFFYRIADASYVEFGSGLMDPTGIPKLAWHALRRRLTGALPTSYLAEGATGFFDLDVAIANPTCTPTTARLKFLRPSGEPIIQDVFVPSQSRITVNANQVPGLATAETSTVVESLDAVPLIVERTMFWDRASYYGGHTGSAVLRPETRWYFGEGSQGFFDTYLLLANSGGAPANVNVSFLREGQSPVSRNITVAPSTRFTIFAGHIPELVDRSFSMVVEADQPVIAERAMYFGKTPFWNAGHESTGVAAPSTRWFHAEGATGAFFDTFILLGNPNDSVATVTLTYLLESGISIARVRTIPPQARLTIALESEDPQLANAAVSTTVSSDVPVVSERAMYWPGGFTSWYEAHNSFGTTETGLAWGLAEGRTGGTQAFDTYILLANPSSREARVRVTYLRQGTFPMIVDNIVLPATSRKNVAMAQAIPQGFAGAVVESTNGVEIIVERAMYWNALGQFWGGGTNATAIKLR